MTVPKVTAEDYIEILAFYARQIHLMDALKIEEYADTFTDDGVIDHAHRNERLAGREAMLAAMRAALPRYRDVVPRHWFDHYLIEPFAEGDGWRVVYYCLVSRTDAQGKVDFEPSFTVEDELVRLADGEIRTRLRVIHMDRPAS
ncbi:actinorhodin biosynthesis protein ActVIA [Streptacidiphilus sp. MAP12-33]|uniref:nuclear transport factor 2 family protein n=1 Tax=Streptacidiphilus sp. MAP12-33 TaxID=3156266 RepID=UPI003518935C